MAHRLLPTPGEAVTLMVNFIAPPAPKPEAPKPQPKSKPPEPKPSPKQPPRQLVAQAPILSPTEAVAPPAPPTPPVEVVAPAPAPTMPLPLGPVALGGELSIVCPARQPPAYPSLSRRLGETGKVVLWVLLDAQGKVAKATVDRSSGFSRLDEAALTAVRSWRCTPAQRNGQVVEATALQPFNFVLEGN